MKRCLRCGCHRPRLDPDFKGLGLCEEHYNQLSAGTIGKDHDPRSKERTVEEMEDYLLQAWEALGKIPKDRALARMVGVPKDTIHHIMGRTWPRFRTAAWIPFMEGVARLRFHHEHPEATDDDGGQWDPGTPTKNATFDLEQLRKENEPPQECTVDGCTKPRIGRGYCTKHYYRVRRNGTPHLQRDQAA